MPVLTNGCHAGCQSPEIFSSKDILLVGGPLVSEFQYHEHHLGLGGAGRFHMGTAQGNSNDSSVGEEVEDARGKIGEDE